MLVLGGGELAQEVAHRVVTGGARGAPVETRSLVFHLLGELAHRVEPERSVQPERAALEKPLHVLAADQREKLAELPAIEFEQHVAMADLLIRHLVVYRRRIRV